MLTISPLETLWGNGSLVRGFAIEYLQMQIAADASSAEGHGSDHLLADNAVLVVHGQGVEAVVLASGRLAHGRKRKLSR